ncbi:MAG: FAD-dependent monooxygenase [Phycisphaerae bacterium]|nr:FAD-dependent monooxygenase [Phycisphaerae bacterium]
MAVDLLIIGAGPVGLTLAHLVARYGLRVEVIERRRMPSGEPRAVSLDDEGLRIWQTCGLDELLRDDWASGDEGQCICEYLDARGRSFLKLHQRTSDLGFPHAVTIHQGRIDEKLLRSAEAHPSITVRRGFAVDAVEQDDRGVTARGVDADGRPFESRAAWLVACDGSNSVVRQALGISWQGDPVAHPWLVANLVDPALDEGRDPGHVMIRCESNRAAVTMPLPHGLRRVEVELPEDDDASWIGDEREVRARLARGWPGADRAPIATVARCTFRAMVAERWREGRVFLAGDAAHVMPPFAGQGLCAGLRDAANLSFKIAGVVQGWLAPCALDSYESERRPHLDRITRLACRLGRLMSPASRTEGVLFQTALRVIGASPALGRNWLLRGPSIQPRLEQGFFNPASPLAGRYIPQPLVVTAAGAQVPLDELLGQRMTWILLAGSRRAPLEPPLLQPSDTVLMEGRDFRDPSEALRRRYGAGSLILVRPDRIVHSHIRASRFRGPQSSRSRRNPACRPDVVVAREARSVASSA